MAEQNTRTQAAEWSFSKALKKLEALKFLDWTATNGIRCNVLPGIEEAGYDPLGCGPLGMLAATGTETEKIEKLRETDSGAALADRIETIRIRDIRPRIAAEQRLYNEDIGGHPTSIRPAIACVVDADPRTAATVGLLPMDADTAQRIAQAAEDAGSADGERLAAALAGPKNELHEDWQLHFGRPIDQQEKHPTTLTTRRFTDASTDEIMKAVGQALDERYGNRCWGDDGDNVEDDGISVTIKPGEVTITARRRVPPSVRADQASRGNGPRSGDQPGSAESGRHHRSRWPPHRRG